MAGFKVALLALALIGVAVANPVADLSANLGGEGDHNYVECNVNKDAVNLLTKTVNVDGFPFIVKTRTINFPEHGAGGAIITCIRITDLVQNGSGGYPYISDGGVNFDHVTIELKSQRSYGFNFRIEIYGVPAPTKGP